MKARILSCISFYLLLTLLRLTPSLFVEFTWERHHSTNPSNLHIILLDLSIANDSLELQVIYQCYVYDFAYHECDELYDFVQETVLSSYPTILIEGVSYLHDDKATFKVIDTGKFGEFLESNSSWRTSFTFTSSRRGELLERLAYKYGTDKR